MRPEELITHVTIPLPPRSDRIGLYKVSKRKEMDISTFRAAIRVRAPGGIIEQVMLAYAGVGPKVLRLPGTERYLAGRPFDEPTFREAGRRARAEVEPISDLRGSRDFRLSLSENILMRFYHEYRRASPGGDP
jgi:xanthine dehydrogenase small subunit